MRGGAGATSTRRGEASARNLAATRSGGLSHAEWAILGALATEPAHGFAVARRLGPEGDLGRIWSVHRPLVYRHLEDLASRDLIECRGHQPGERGPRRVLYGITPAGRATLEGWLARPVEHVREVRSLLLLKLALAGALGAGTRELLVAQEAVLTALANGLEGRLAGAGGFEEVLLGWRLESARSAVRFVQGRLEPARVGR